MEDKDKPEEEKKPEEQEKISPVDEAKGILKNIQEEKAELILENAKKAQLQSDALLSGTGGAAVPVVEAKEESPKEYNERIEKEISEGKHEE